MPVTIQSKVRSFSEEKQTVPGLIPQTAEDLATSDVYVDLIVLTPHATDSDTVTIKDKQGTPRTVFGPIVVDPGAPVVAKLYSRYAPGGLTWESATGNKVTGYVSWQQ